MRKKQRNKVWSILLMVMVSMFMFGCGADQTDSNTEEQKTVAEESTEAESKATDNDTSETIYPVEVTDSNGDIVTIDQEPEKIISVAPNLTELVYELGLEDKLVGRSDYCDYPEEVASVETVGTLQTPDVEKIISLDPDLVVASTHFDEEIATKLEAEKIPVLILYEEKEMTGVYDMITTLGQAMNCNDKAAACVDNMKETIEEVETAVKDQEKPSVYYVVGYGESGDYTAGGDTFVGAMIETAGGENIAKDVSGWNISLEKIVEADPDIIVLSEYFKDDFVKTKPYKNLTAVKEGKVYTIDTNLLDRQGYRNAEGIRTLAEIFHPEVFQ